MSDEQNTQQGTHNDQVCNTNEDNTDEFTAVDGASNRSLTPSSINNEDGDVDSDSESNISTQSKTCEVSTTSINRKRKLDPASNVPKLVDNKRKNLEKRLSAAQRDQKLLGAAKEDTAMRKEMLECFKDSSSSTALAIENMSVTLKDMSQGMTQAMLLLANSLSQPRQPTYAPYQFNQPLLRPNEPINVPYTNPFPEDQDSSLYQMN